jgi:predicted peroxiredoxin
MAKFLFVLGTGMENPSKGTRCLQIAGIAREEGHEVSVFLLDDGVIFAKKGMTENIVAPTGDDMQTHMEKLQTLKVPFYVCTPCAKARQISESDFIENARLSTAKQLIALAVDSKVFSF